MRRNWVFGDLLSQLVERTGQVWGNDDTRSLTDLCTALLSAEGEVSGYKLAATVLDRYRTSDDEAKLAFFAHLNDALDIDATHVADLAQDYASAPTIAAFKALSQAAEPRRQELLRRLNQPVGATEALVAMRADLLRFVKLYPDLARTDFDFKHLLRSWFNRGFLVLQQINWTRPRVSSTRSWPMKPCTGSMIFDDLRRRLRPSDRRCFAFFHPAMPDEPLIFVEVALTPAVPNSIARLLEEDRDPLDPAQAKAAVFYSISNCQKGLAGISFGNLLIKQVVAELSMELPKLETFVTLSPIPRLNQWLDAQVAQSELAAPIQAAKDNDDTLKGLAAHYLLCAKRDDGLPFDPVARFHLGNGAEISDIHAGADVSENGLAQSGGAMVNYLYDLRRTERNHEEFASSGTIAATRAVQTLASSVLETKTKTKEKVA